MEAEARLMNPALPNVAPADGDQQGMSPSTVVATTATDRPSAGDGASEGTKGLGKGSSAVEAEVAVRMMAVSMAASPGVVDYDLGFATAFGSSLDAEARGLHRGDERPAAWPSFVESFTFRIAAEDDRLS
eukprot:s6287_g4.t1